MDNPDVKEKMTCLLAPGDKADNDLFALKKIEPTVCLHFTHAF
jgi:hypothetical protein